MVKIFISYRRADSQTVTDRLHDHLVMHFDDESVFQDVDSIPFGVDFPEYLSAEVDKCDVVLVVIGKEWERIMQERADHPDDFVRIEVESALRLGKLVIPVLVNGATMPNPNNLPPSVRDLCRKNAAPVRPNPDFRRDCQRLADGIRQVMKASATSTPAAARPTSIALMPDPFAWIEIPGKGYSIAKYPITNAQFAKFIEAGGYKQQKWWTQAGWEAKAKGWAWNSSKSEWEETGIAWTQPRYWTDSKWNGAEQPVVGVSWYEAVAFCLWLSDVTDEKIMLPTEDQWQYAAQGDDGRVYPWGNDWNCERCNNSVGPCSSTATTPVRQYEGVNGRSLGESPFGVVDMAGNVWEWCLTDENNDNNINQDLVDRVLRGGSWDYFGTGVFRCDWRDAHYPHNWYNNFGFRICRS